MTSCNQHSNITDLFTPDWYAHFTRFAKIRTDTAFEGEIMAARLVFNTYELAEQIVLRLPQGDVWRSAQINRTCYTIRADSLAVAKHTAPRKTLEDKEAGLQQAAHPGYSVEAVLERVAESYAAGRAIRPMDAIPITKQQLQSKPHYILRAGNPLMINAAFTPSFGVPSLVGTAVEMHLPLTPTPGFLGCHPSEFVTDPPIAELRMDLLRNGSPSDTIRVYRSKGITMKDMFRALKDILEDNDGTQTRNGRLECRATLAMDVDTQKLRCGLSEDLKQ
ncbi:hypothetical protein LTR56_007890 [Elasticomyces elasticus]|nr:hypothetical protein LTR56_007890 [Elasticomyces elasticus]KAK3663691.1 hypothetical protein LTR22_005392 [Elasticomyces elasticus]KAK4927209.1 hypothetical protein LTR49_005874 [Elasticomyces elasticus]KAK5767385.1 hypothetical protein LTS12_002538 [Elasticomyces elasticus]